MPTMTQTYPIHIYSATTGAGPAAYMTAAEMVLWTSQGRYALYLDDARPSVPQERDACELRRALNARRGLRALGVTL